MRYAISNWIYPGEPLRETFARLARYGYDGIELVGEPDRVSPEEIRALSQEYGLSIISILTWCIWGIPGRDMASPDEEERQAAGVYGRRCVDLAVAVGAPIVVVLPAPAGRTAPLGSPRDEKAWKEAWEREWVLAVESLRGLAAYAQSRGITLALEPINRYETHLVSTTDQALRMLEAVGADNLKIHLDTFHMNIEEADMAAAIRRAGNLLVNMHISDSNRMPPGRGHTNFGALLLALREINYTGALVLEPVPPGSDPLLAVTFSENIALRDTFAEESIRYLRELEKQI
ncbi:MAG: sugar phosphate isomerase/epimerase family protein [Anaerolineae bacterium]|nr:sugar phosphate isomerase/epimerase family protein [Anaerolineae bacterium]